MIVSIRGTLEAKRDGSADISIGGVTLQVLMSTSDTIDLCEIGQKVHLHTYLQVKDEQLLMYGFSTVEASYIFKLLLGVSGIGPRTALNLLSSQDPKSLAAAIANGDVDTLSSASGVGKKGAGRIVLELRSKLSLEAAEILPNTKSTDNELVSALTALGYSIAEIRHSIASLGDITNLSLEEKVRRALQQLAGV